ncbi:MAG: hypothetical protein GIW99_08670 [Candidatus Eremiobacteraeota bacterium]|nr:hypothetical protein [Candidatus Eremiobacteraeota bacterium]
MDETIKCAHDACSCNVSNEPDVEDYCCDYCNEQGTGGSDSPCQCGHLECA